MSQPLKTRILITGGNGNIATILKRSPLAEEYTIFAPGRSELNLLNGDDVKAHLEGNSYDVLIHTAVSGGRRTKAETGDVTHANLVMTENLLRFADKFKMIINLDSAATYDRKTDILNRKEDEVWSVPSDFYGFSKYVIFQRTLAFAHAFNLRIFNIFHAHEEVDRFIKRCFICAKNNDTLVINEDKYFDFVFSEDFVKVVRHYLQHIDQQNSLYKTVNVCYTQKMRLSDVARLIINDARLIRVEKNADNNYSGDGRLLLTYNLDLAGLESSLNEFSLVFKKNP